MRIQQIDIDKIIFIKKEYSNSMYESIKYFPHLYLCFDKPDPHVQ